MSTAEEKPSPSGVAEVASLFDRESTGYDEAHEGGRGHFLRARIAAVAGLLGEGPGTALDAGMGPGRLVEELTALGWTVSGIDVSDRMVARARARVPAASERLVQGSIDALPFADRSFDAVAAIGVIEYLEDPGAVIAELARVLRPGGALVVSMPNTASLHSRWSHGVWYPAVRAAKRMLPGFPRPAPYVKPGVLSAGALVRAASAAGADPVALRHLGATVLPPPLDVAAPRLARRLSQRVEGRPTRAARALSGQVLLTTRKPRNPRND